MSEPTPTPEDVRLARKAVCWAGAGLEIFRHKLAVEFARVRTDTYAKAREACWGVELKKNSMDGSYSIGRIEGGATCAAAIDDLAAGRPLQEPVRQDHQARTTHKTYACANGLHEKCLGKVAVSFLGLASESTHACDCPCGHTAIRARGAS